MRKRPLDLQYQININKREILSNKMDLERIEKRIDDRHNTRKSKPK